MRCEKAELISVKLTRSDKIHTDLIDSNCIYLDGETTRFDKIPNGILLVMYFVAENGVPFTHIIHGYATAQIKYEKMIGQIFDIVVVEERKPEAVQEKLL
jgi:hypothetical protein